MFFNYINMLVDIYNINGKIRTIIIKGGGDRERK